MAVGMKKVEHKLSGTLSEYLSDTATTVDVNNPPTEYPTYLVIEPDTSNEEIVKVTNVSGNTLTIVRAQGGTSAKEHQNGSAYEQRWVHLFPNENIDTFDVEHDKDDGTHDDTKVAMLAGTQEFTGDKTFSGAVKVDTISEKTTDAGVTTDGVLHKDNETILNNNKAFKAKDSGGTARNIAKVNASNVLEIGDSNLSGAEFKVMPPIVLADDTYDWIGANTNTTTTWQSVDITSEPSITVPNGQTYKVLVIGTFSAEMDAGKGAVGIARSNDNFSSETIGDSLALVMSTSPRAVTISEVYELSAGTWKFRPAFKLIDAGNTITMQYAVALAVFGVRSA